MTKTTDSNKGYRPGDNMPGDAYAAVNDLMVDMGALWFCDFIMADKFLSVPEMKALADAATGMTRFGVRRMVLASFASVMYRFTEIYDDLLNPLGCVNEDAVALRRSISRNKVDSLRHIYHHAIDSHTRRVHSLDKVTEVFKAFDQIFPDLSEARLLKLMKLFATLREVIGQKYPGAATAVTERHHRFINRE